MRRPALAYVLAVDLLAMALGVLQSTAGSVPSVTLADVRIGLLLALGCAVHVEVARGIERRREVVAEGRPYIEPKSVWSFAGVLLLPVGPALLLVLFTFAYWWLRVSSRPVLHRWVFSAATAVLGTLAAADVLAAAPKGAVLTGGAGPWGLLLVAVAAVVRWVLNHGLVVGAIALADPRTTWAERRGSPTDMAIGLGALALGAAVAVLAHVTPWIVPVLLVPVAGMHRGVLVGQFARAASTDGKTGLATAAAWYEQARVVVDRARRRTSAVPRNALGPGAGPSGDDTVGVGVLMVDLDEFKRVNDRYGHLVGDVALRTVAEALRAEVRDTDLVGRFGGEEFVVLLDRVGSTEVRLVAERIRRRIAACELPDHGVRGLTVSVGAAVASGALADVDTLMRAADAALLAAKRAGRDRVELTVGP